MSRSLKGKMVNNRKWGCKSSEWQRHYAMLGGGEGISCWSKIVRMVFAIRGMVLVSFFVDRSVVGQTEPTVFVATYFTCRQP